MQISTEILLILLSFTTGAAPAESGYARPPKAILDVMRAPTSPQPSLAPTGDKILLIGGLQDYPSIERIAAPFVKLAGVRIEPQNHARHDTPGGYGVVPCVKTLDLVDVATGKQKSIAMTKLRCADRPRWSADGRYFALTDRAAKTVDLYVGDTRTGRLVRIAGANVNTMFGNGVHWMPDQKSLLVKLVPRGARPVPKPVATPKGPVIQEAKGERGQSSTYEKRDTLTGKYDEDLFDYYGESQLARVDVPAGKVTPLGKPGVYDDVDVAPDGAHLLVQAIVKPYSYVTTYDRFPRNVEVWTLGAAAHVSKTTLASIPLADRVPIHGVRTGPRDYEWHPAQPATLIWAEALDGGDWNNKVPARDKLSRVSAPFTAPPVEIIRLEQRYNGFDWLSASQGLLNQRDENTHWRKTLLVDVDDPKKPAKLIFDLSEDEQYLDPGYPIRQVQKNGTYLVRREGDRIFLRADGASVDGDRPFVDELDLSNLKKTRLFRSDRTDYEQPIGFVGDDNHKLVTWHQSPSEVPNAYLRLLGGPIAAGADESQVSSTATAITHLADPTPQLRQIKKRLVKYKRADGVELSFVLYTPPDYREGTRVPTILYAYPLDYADAAKAGQVSGSQATFTRLVQYRLLLLAGYAVIDRAAFPIVGDPKKAYDTYLEQLISNAKAAVEEAVRLGVADAKRIGVTGHSHGALMTANLVTHTKLFRAGVATSGAYNKVLTPFGFQNERRTLWEAPDVYRKISPYYAADKIKTPLLLIHGDSDANPGTTPMQATFLFDAIRGNGGVTRLVMLPHEPHWYAARESNEQLLAEMVSWFDKYVKLAD